MDYQLRYDLQTGKIEEAEFQPVIINNVEVHENDEEKEETKQSLFF